MLLASLTGMLLMTSARDLISIFISLELLSIPAYLLAGWRKRDLRGNEASLKYYLLGVFASGVMLYGMSLLFGVTGSTLLVDIGRTISTGESIPMVTLAIVFVVAGFAFKVSAVPFHTWAPDTYEGAPTPITAFLSVASKAAGFVALLNLVYLAFWDQSDVWQPLFWTLAALTMTVGNLIALRQTNVIRLLAYSSIAQAGFMLVPLAVAADARDTALQAIITYILIYTAMNLGAFAVVMAVVRKTRSAELKDFGGLFEYAPGLTVVLTVFFFALAGIPPLGGWYAKFVMFRAVFDSLTPAAVVLGIIAAVNSVIALFYYASVAREAWMAPVPDDDRTPVRITPSLAAAMAICVVVTVGVGVLPGIVGHFGDLATFALGK
jgi:NADH-quinone oxidoreductase subunit N